MFDIFVSRSSLVKIVVQFFGTLNNSVAKCEFKFSPENVNIKFVKAYVPEISLHDLWERSCTSEHYTISQKFA